MTQANSKPTIQKYGHRFWALYDGKQLVCVTVYKRGALEVAHRLWPKIYEPTIQSALREHPHEPSAAHSALVPSEGS